MIAMPVALAIYLTAKWKLGGRIWWIGVATLIASQVGHIPFNWAMGKLLNQTGMVAWNPTYQLIFNAVFIGLSAGIFEEGTRYLVLRWWAKDARSWKKGVLFGAGHGGAEAIILGAIVLYGFFQLAALRNADLTKVIPANQLALAQNQLHTYWSATWYYSLFGALERFFSIPSQIALAVMVLQVFSRRRTRWLFMAIGLHALEDGIGTVLAPRYLGLYWTEAILGVFALVSMVIIFALRRPDPPVESLLTKEAIKVPTLEPLEDSLENLENTRYQ